MNTFHTVESLRQRIQKHSQIVQREQFLYLLDVTCHRHYNTSPLLKIRLINGDDAIELLDAVNALNEEWLKRPPVVLVKRSK